MEFNLSKIKYSNNDLKNSVIIPKKLTKELAEFLGIMVGDGHIGSWNYHRQIIITGNIRDKEYYFNYVNNLIYKIFNIKFNIYFQNSRNAVIMQKHSKALFIFLKNVIGIPERKDSIEVPKCIMKSSKEEKISFLRGLADADFCFTIKHKPKEYPVISGASKSEALVKQTKKLLDELEIGNCYLKEAQYYLKRDKTYVTHRVYVNGYKNTKKWMEIISFSNQNVVKRYKEFIASENN